MSLKSILKNSTPLFLLKIKRKIHIKYIDSKTKKDLKKTKKSQPLILKQLQNKEKLNVIFLVIHDSVWKYEEIYKLLENDPKFKVEIVVIPLVRSDMGDMEVFNKTLYYFIQNNYNVISSFDKVNTEWLDIKQITKPDIVFFTNPHKLTFNKYYISNFTNTLTCYVPYAFVVIHLLESHYNQAFHKYLWKYFIETKYHQKFSNQFIDIDSRNTIVTGFPGLDKKFNPSFNPKNVWKPSIKKTIKIIWAPHHTIKGQDSGLNYSSFMEYSSYFMEFLQQNKNIQIAFKPHPLLKEKLYLDKDWGKTKTDLYYKKWNEIPNGQLEEGEYLSLFHYSDAMILDSASFIVEYLYFNKPIIFTMKDDSILDRFNSFGKKVFNYLYKAKNKSDINIFINNVIQNKDELSIERDKFLNEVILPNNRKTASENIYNELKKELC